MADGLIKFAQTVHGTVGATSLAFYFLVQKRADDLYGISEKFDPTVSSMRRSISEALSRALKPVFENPPIEVTANEDAYVERATSPVDSENYRSAVGGFIESHADAILDYQKVRDHCQSHARFHHRIQWTLFALAFWSALSFASISLRESVWPAAQQPRAWLAIVGLSVAGSAALVLCAFAFEAIRHRNEQSARDLRSKYDTLS